MAKPSVEQIKDESRQLRGSLAADLASEADHFDEAGKQLLKFHGIYQQDRRDARKDTERKKAGLGKLFFFFVHSKIPGDKLSAEQYLTHDELCDRFGAGIHDATAPPTRRARSSGDQVRRYESRLPRSRSIWSTP